MNECFSPLHQRIRVFIQNFKKIPLVYTFQDHGQFIELRLYHLSNIYQWVANFGTVPPLYRNLSLVNEPQQKLHLNLYALQQGTVLYFVNIVFSLGSAQKKGKFLTNFSTNSVYHRLTYTVFTHFSIYHVVTRHQHDSVPNP
jgi:hypothetical protein